MKVYFLKLCDLKKFLLMDARRLLYVCLCAVILFLRENLKSCDENQCVVMVPFQVVRTGKKFLLDSAILYLHSAKNAIDTLTCFNMQLRNPGGSSERNK